MPQVNQTYRVLDCDGHDTGKEFRTYLMADGDGNRCVWYGYYGGDSWRMCQIEEGEERYDSGDLEWPDSLGGTSPAQVCFEPPLPEPHPPGAVGWIHKPGEPRRWLVPA